jgi:hypothetical protein
VGDGGQDENRRKDRRSEAPSDAAHHYDQTSSVQFLGLGNLTDEEKTMLTETEKHNLKGQPH